MGTDREILGASFQTVARRIVKRGLNDVRATLRRYQDDPGGSGTVARPASYPEEEPQHWLDRQVDRVLRHYVHDVDPAIVYESEEWDADRVPNAGDVIARADPIDGTTHARTLFGGYAVVIYFEQVDPDRAHVTNLAGAIAASTAEVVSWNSIRGEVLVEWAANFRWKDSQPKREDKPPRTLTGSKPVRWKLLNREAGERTAEALKRGDPDRVAAVANKPKRRQALRERLNLDETDLWFANSAGNPLIAPLLLGDLGGIVEPLPIKSLHDAAYLLPLHYAGAHIRFLDDRKVPLNAPDYFTDFIMGKKERIEKGRQVPEFVAATSEDLLAEIDKLLERKDTAR